MYLESVERMIIRQMVYEKNSIANILRVFESIFPYTPKNEIKKEIKKYKNLSRGG